MKIKSLEIYGFGKLENVKIDEFSQGIQVFYGRNEAGKSTLMAFIHAILFGFPLKNQTELRYEPKKGYKYGGRLIMETKEGKLLTIERVAGKSAGDVTVIDEKGMNLSIDSVLAGIDRSIYKGIFSFNIMDVQNLKLVDLEQLGGYLFSSGLIGSDKLQRISDQLNKSMEELFKPGGRKPVMNKLMGDLKEEEKTVLQWKQKLEQYESLQKDIQHAANKLKTLKVEKEKLSAKLRKIDAMVAIQPIEDQLSQLKREHSKLGDYSTFPIDGIARLEKLLIEQSNYNSRLEKLGQDRFSLDKKIEQIEVDEALLEQQERIESLLIQFPKYQESMERLAFLSTEEQRLEKQIQVLKMELKWKEKHGEQVEGIDTSLAAKAELRGLLQQQNKLSLQKEHLDEEFQQAKDDLEKQEDRIASLLKEQLPREEVQQLQKKVQGLGVERLETDIAIQEQLLHQMEGQIQQQEHEHVQMKKKNKLASVISISAGGAGAAVLYMQDNTLLGLFLFILSLGIGGYLFFTKASTSLLIRLQKDREAQKEKLSKIKETLYTSPERTGLEKYRLMLAKEKQIEELLQKERLLLSQSERTYDRIILQFEEWEKQQFSFDEKWKEWTEYRGLGAIPASHMEEAFAKAIELKTVFMERQNLHKSIQLSERMVDQFRDEASKIMNQLGLTQSSLEEAFYYLKAELEKNERNKQILDDLYVKGKEIEEEATYLTIQKKDATEKIGELMKRAGVSKEEEFRLKHQQFQKGTEYEQNMSLLQLQLEQVQNSYGIIPEKGKTLSMWNSEKAETEEQIRLLSEEQAHYYQLKTKREEAVRTLEEGGTYSDAVQKFEMSKSHLQEQARKWAVLATSQQLLNRTMDYYRTVKLPEVLNKASDYFRFLTNGEYSQVYDPTNETKLMVKHKNGLSFEPKELSQATVEQLYISIRFAVASVWSREQRFPFMMDDSFVNFDHIRTVQALDLMKKMTEEGEQLLFFTCHEHMKSLFEKVENSKIVELERTYLPITIS
ncbi:AAA family ATPase [Sutcliffiella sp. NPDC057660]|uniref:ATP-binding protein n=1 Tax=Sutcliffiella sp. NPDC057660 TaxID=3346199 RepID=UPI0036CABD08